MPVLICVAAVVVPSMEMVVTVSFATTVRFSASTLPEVTMDLLLFAAASEVTSIWIVSSSPPVTVTWPVVPVTWSSLTTEASTLRSAPVVATTVLTVPLPVVLRTVAAACASTLSTVPALTVTIVSAAVTLSVSTVAFAPLTVTLLLAVSVVTVPPVEPDSSCAWPLAVSVPMVAPLSTVTVALLLAGMVTSVSVSTVTEPLVLTPVTAPPLLEATVAFAACATLTAVTVAPSAAVTVTPLPPLVPVTLTLAIAVEVATVTSPAASTFVTVALPATVTSEPLATSTASMVPLVAVTVVSLPLALTVPTAFATETSLAALTVVILLEPVIVAESAEAATVTVVAVASEPSARVTSPPVMFTELRVNALEPLSTVTLASASTILPNALTELSDTPRLPSPLAAALRIAPASPTTATPPAMAVVPPATTRGVAPVSLSKINLPLTATFSSLTELEPPPETIRSPLTVTPFSVISPSPRPAPMRRLPSTVLLVSWLAAVMVVVGLLVSMYQSIALVVLLPVPPLPPVVVPAALV